MKSLACIDHFDFDNTAFAAAHAVDSMHADRAIIDKPRHHQLSHWNALFWISKERTYQASRLRIVAYCITVGSRRA
jgi:hypothetical protein